MNTLITIALSITVISLFGLNYFRNKYKKLNSKAKSIISELEKPLRIGYYTIDCTQGEYSYTGVVQVYELDRYTNGDSKIKLKEVDITNQTSSSINLMSARSFMEREVPSIKKTTEITWLESENELKEQRRNKLNKLKEVIKN